MVFETSEFKRFRQAHEALAREIQVSKIEKSLWDRVAMFIDELGAGGEVLQNLDLRDSAQAILDYWVAALHTHTRELKPGRLMPYKEMQPLEGAVNERCPYVGTRPYVETDHELFFGREKEVDDACQILLEKRCVAVRGQSGIGKSSFALAGLLPRLKSLTGAGESLKVCRVLPVPDPLTRFSLALGVELPRQTSRNNRWQHLRDQMSVPGRLVVVDQFEEVFTRMPSGWEQEGLLELLMHWMDVLEHGDPSSHGWLVLTFRNDQVIPRLKKGSKVYDKFEDYILKRGMALDPMKERELRVAIAGPAERCGVTFEEDVVETLAHDVVNDEFALPVMQSCLVHLWKIRDKEPRNRISMQSYLRLGGPALFFAERAADFGRKMEKEDKGRLLRRVVLRLLVSHEEFGVTSARLTREELVLGQSPKPMDDLLTEMENAGLLRLTRAIGADPKNDLFEVSHEAVFSKWPAARSWIQEYAKVLHGLRRLDERSRQWRQDGEPAKLLATSVEVETWQALLAHEQTKELGPFQIADDYVKASERKLRQRKKVLVWTTVTLLALACAAIVYGRGLFEQTVTLEKAVTKSGTELKQLVDEKGRLLTAIDTVPELLTLKKERMALSAQFALETDFQKKQALEKASEVLLAQTRSGFDRLTSNIGEAWAPLLKELNAQKPAENDTITKNAEELKIIAAQVVEREQKGLIESKFAKIPEELRPNFEVYFPPGIASDALTSRLVKAGVRVMEDPSIKGAALKAPWVVTYPNYPRLKGAAEPRIVGASQHLIEVCNYVTLELLRHEFPVVGMIERTPSDSVPNLRLFVRPKRETSIDMITWNPVPLEIDDLAEWTWVCDWVVLGNKENRAEHITDKLLNLDVIKLYDIPVRHFVAQDAKKQPVVQWTFGRFSDAAAAQDVYQLLLRPASNIIDSQIIGPRYRLTSVGMYRLRNIKSLFPTVRNNSATLVPQHP
ncbi:MAG: hypothetical protein ACO1TE_20640 [Prosthecobacter sp.]